jgi:hypothetical protein
VPVALLLLGLVVVAVVAYFSWQAKQRRRSALATFAAAHGLTFSPVDTGALERSYAFDLFSLGDGRGCENVISGAWQGVPMREADYWYYEQSTDGEGHTSRSYSRFSVVVVDLDGVLPVVRIERENLLSRLADHLGMSDIEFESEEFNRCFNVKAKDQEFAFKLLDARMMQWLLDAPDKVCLEVVGPNVLLYCGRLPAERVGEVFAAAKSFVDHVPRLVWTEYGKAAS